MVVIRSQKIIRILGRNPMNQNVMYSLDIERFFDLGVRRNEQMYQYAGWDEQ